MHHRSIKSRNCMDFHMYGMTIGQCALWYRYIKKFAPYDIMFSANDRIIITFNFSAYYRIVYNCNHEVIMN